MKVLGRLKFALSALVLSATMVLCGTASPTMAEERPKQRIQVSPASMELGTMKPGSSYTKTIKIQNTGSENLKYSLSVTPYSVSGENYQQNFSAETSYTDIAKWITLSQEGGEIVPNGQDEVTVTIKVPQDVPAGGQYAAIMARIENDHDLENSSGISAISQAGIVVYSSVDGETRRDGSVLENKVPSFMFAPPISATSIVENTGNVHAEATYTLQVYPLFGSEEVYTNEENPERATIMPETRRLNTVTWDGAPQLGLFKIKQTVKFLGKESVTEKVLFICPIWFMMIILVLIFLIVFWIVTRARGRKED